MHTSAHKLVRVGVPRQRGAGRHSPEPTVRQRTVQGGAESRLLPAPAGTAIWGAKPRRSRLIPQGSQAGKQVRAERPLRGPDFCRRRKLGAGSFGPPVQVTQSRRNGGCRQQRSCFPAWRSAVLTATSATRRSRRRDRPQIGVDPRHSGSGRERSIQRLGAADSRNRRLKGDSTPHTATTAGVCEGGL